ncbi:rhomboid family intramembrane serine protease [Lachnospiraceae bacterium 48-21]
MHKNRIYAPCTVVLAAVNVIVFFVLSLQGMTEDGMFLLEHGAMFIPKVLEDGEYYRLFTSMFLHFGFEHLMNNMVTFVLIGWNLEIEIGGIKFLLIYILSGLGGNILSAWYDIQTMDYSISAGASGAIFGIIGALLYVAMRNRGHIGDISGRRILVMIAISLYYGFSSSGVDNLAHVGGLVTGFLSGVLLYWKNNGKDRTFSEN